MTINEYRKIETLRTALAETLKQPQMQRALEALSQYAEARIIAGTDTSEKAAFLFHEIRGYKTCLNNLFLLALAPIEQKETLEHFAADKKTDKEDE